MSMRGCFRAMAMAKLTRAQIIRKGSVEIDVTRQGSRQKIEFKVEKEETPVGKVPYLVTERIVDLSELLRVASEYDLPIKAPNGKFFPPGKKATDYV